LPEVGEGFEAGQLGLGGELPEVGGVPPSSREEIEFEGKLVKKPIPDTIARGSDTYVLPLTENKVLGAALSANKQNLVFYDKEAQKFYRISSDGKSKLPLSDEKFYNVESVDWSPDSTRAIITYPDDIKIFYDFSSRQKTTLPKEVKEPVFSADSNKISFKYETTDENKNFLAVAKPDGSETKLIEPMGAEGNKVQATFSPEGEVVALYAKPTSLNSSEVFFIGQAGENFKSLQVAGMHIKGKWSPSGSRLLYHSVMAENDFNPNLWLVDARGDSIGSHQFNLNLTTWVDKCVFASEFELYCAVPKNLPAGAGLYPEAAETAFDEIYKIDLKNGNKQMIANPVLEQGRGEFRIGSLWLSGDGRLIFFWDELTEGVYSMQLR
jgi:hypothetical protein